MEISNPAILFPSIWQLTSYTILHNEKYRKYPTYRCNREAHQYFLTKEEALTTIQNYQKDDVFSGEYTYCLALRELPLDTHLLECDSFSEQLYLPNGTLWSERSFAHITPQHDDYIDKKCFFRGRKQKEIRFHKGDLIEIFCYEGNEYWSEGYIELAIVVDTPPTMEEITGKINQCQSNSNNSSNERDLLFCSRCGASIDAYTVIPAYCSLHDTPHDLIDYCSTHCAFPPRQKVSTRMRNKMMKQLERLSNTEYLKPKLIDLFL